MNEMQIFIASDHGGYELKTAILRLFANNYKLIDLGTDSVSISADYPDYAQKLAFSLHSQKGPRFGILICKSGIGMSIAANRFTWLRAALCHNKGEATLARIHNDANVLVLAANSLNIQKVKEIISTFISTEFIQEERHSRRIKKLS